MYIDMKRYLISMMTLNNFNIRISLWGSLAITFAIWAFTIYYISEFCLIKEFSVFIYSSKWSQVINCNTMNCHNNSYAYCVFRLLIWKSTSRWNAVIYIIARICKNKIRNFSYWQHFLQSWEIHIIKIFAPNTLCQSVSQSKFFWLMFNYSSSQVL